MSQRLVVVEGPQRGAQVVLDGRPVVEVGSAAVADLVLAGLAGIHLKLYREADGFTCYDVTGAGFGHNDRPAVRAVLRPGDTLRLGQHGLRVLTDDIERIPTAAPAPVGATPPALPPGWALLRAVRGNDAGRSFPLGEKDAVILGRGASSDITVWDIRASRAHCRIDRMAAGYVISDLNSSNGTYVNGERIERHGLRPGDVIKIGASEFLFAGVGQPA